MAAFDGSVVWAECALSDLDEGALGTRERAELARLRGASERRDFIAGRIAAHRAIARLVGSASAESPEVLKDAVGRPYVEGRAFAVSISHGRQNAVAAAGRVRSLGIDLCHSADAPRLRELAGRFLPSLELGTERDYCAAWAAKEAGLKALGLGLLDGGVFDPLEKQVVRVVSLHPPRLAPAHLNVDFADAPYGVVAVAWD